MLIVIGTLQIFVAPLFHLADLGFCYHSSLAKELLYTYIVDIVDIACYAFTTAIEVVRRETWISEQLLNWS